MTNSEYSTIQFKVDQGLAILTLDRPDRLNSFNTQMHEEVRCAFDVIESDKSIRCLLITGAGRGFCAGQDLTDRAVSSNQEMPDLSQSIEKNYNPLIMRMSNLPIPIIGAINGVAAGAGANIALACDLVYASEQTSFIQSFNKLGLVPDCGGTWILPRLVGHAQAMKLCLLGEKVPANKAKEMGMIAEVVAHDELESVTIKLGQQLAKAPTLGLSLIKQSLKKSSTNTLQQQLELEKELQGIAGKSQDFREGVTAFVEKREPKYQGC